jgi:small multidrug resistance pump
MSGWAILLAAIVCEVIATTMMKMSDSLTKWGWIPPMLLFYILALVGLALALRTIEVGVAYAVWAATGTMLVALIGIAAFGERITALKLISIFVVIAGVIGLRLSDRFGL